MLYKILPSHRYSLRLNDAVDACATKNFPDLQQNNVFRKLLNLLGVWTVYIYVSY